MTERVGNPVPGASGCFLPPYNPEHVLLSTDRPMAVDPLTNGYLLMEYRRKHMEAQQRALEVLREVNRILRKPLAGIGAVR